MISSLNRSAFAAALSAMILLCSCENAGAETALIAAAANFRDAAEQLEAAFERSSDHDVTFSFGSTGKLYAQIRRGAPYDMFLAADAARPMRLQREGFAAREDQITYAIGKLTLWSPDPNAFPDRQADKFLNGAFQKIAIANPELAPYGAAATEVMSALGLKAVYETKLVTGENAGQAFALTAKGGAGAGFVALSTVAAGDPERRGSRWDPPRSLYSPIRQNAVLLSQSRDNEAAKAFFAFLQTQTARTIIADAGYDLAD